MITAPFWVSDVMADAMATKTDQFCISSCSDFSFWNEITFNSSPSYLPSRDHFIHVQLDKLNNILPMFDEQSRSQVWRFGRGCKIRMRIVTQNTFESMAWPGEHQRERDRLHCNNASVMWSWASEKWRKLSWNQVKQNWSLTKCHVHVDDHIQACSKNIFTWKLEFQIRFLAKYMCNTKSNQQQNLHRCSWKPHNITNSSYIQLAQRNIKQPEQETRGMKQINNM